MNITISSETGERLRQKAEAEGLSIEAYIEHLVLECEGWDDLAEAPITRQDTEFSEVQAAVMEGLEQARSGKGRPAEHVFAELQAKHGIPR